MKRVILQLSVTVAFSKHDGSDFKQAELDQLQRNLTYMPQYAAQIGAYTDDAPNVTVDMFDFHVSPPRQTS